MRRRGSTWPLPLLLAAILPAQAAAKPDPARAFFARGAVVEVAILLDPADRQRLRDRPREYVEATLRVDGDRQAWTGVGVKLKGAAGSFRAVDDRPASPSTSASSAARRGCTA